MFNEHRLRQFELYNNARDHMLANNKLLTKVERLMADMLVELISRNKEDIKHDYDEASTLYPFWQNYPPDDRGRQPVGDQYPWIEVGEHAIGSKLSRMLAPHFTIRDVGLPTGPDQRFVLRSSKIEEAMDGFTDAVFLFVDIKSVGPRDNSPHAVMSHNQISGDGVWKDAAHGVRNNIIVAHGGRTSHNFHCSVSPIYVLKDETIVPVVHLVIKPIYKMLSLDVIVGGQLKRSGQPLEEIKVVCIPNGLLLTVSPGYLQQHPGLLFPGKDDKAKNPFKLRARVSFDLLTEIDGWRVQTILF